jgi:hypothetical protein
VSIVGRDERRADPAREALPTMEPGSAGRALPGSGMLCGPDGWNLSDPWGSLSG